MRCALLGAMTAGVVLTQQACANGTAAEPAAAPPASQVAATPSAAATPSSGASEPTGEAAPDDGSLADCKTGDIAANITLQPDAKGATRMGLVTLTNRSAMECNIGGRAAISLTNPAGEVVDVPTQNVDEPGKAARTALKSGSSVFQGIKWTVCDKGDETCGAGNALVFSLGTATGGEPAELSGFPAPEKNDITMKSLKVGTIQLSRQGVVAW